MFNYHLSPISTTKMASFSSDLWMPSTTANATSNHGEFLPIHQPLERNWFFLFLIPLILCSAGGNILVILAVMKERKLKNKINYFLQSLAVADLMVSVLVMPFGVAHDFLGYWAFGQVMCNIWATLDVLNCTASILHMCVMSVERYIAICHPLYHRKQKRFPFQKVGVKIALVWLISIALSSLLFIVGQIRPHALYVNNACQVSHTNFQLYGSVFAFFIPLVIVIVTYTLTAIKLFKKSRMYEDNLNKNKFAKKVQCLRQDITDQGEIPEEINPEENLQLMQRIRPRANSATIRRNENPFLLGRPRPGSHRINGNVSHREGSFLGRRGSATLPMYEPKGSQRKLTLTRHSSGSRTNSTRSNLSAVSGLNLNVSKEQQASIVLGLVFTAFVISWTPFFIMNIYYAMCPTCVPDDNTMLFFEWLGWASSLINPFIYTVFNKSFRKTFWRLLRCHCFWGQKRRARWNERDRVNVKCHLPCEGTTRV